MKGIFHELQSPHFFRSERGANHLGSHGAGSDKTNRWISFWNEHVPDLISFGVEIGFSLLIFFVGRFLIRWIRRIVRRSIERSSADTGVEQFIDSLLKFLLYTLLLFIIIQNLGVPPLPSLQSLPLPA